MKTMAINNKKNRIEVEINIGEKMSPKDMTEKIYYEDSTAKVTNVRVTCNNLTAPLEKIGSVNINYKTEKFAASVVCLVLACSPFLFYGLFPANIKFPIAIVSLIIILGSAVFVYLNYINYVQLLLSVAGRSVCLMTTGMLNKQYLENICGKISLAILDERKYRDLKDSGELESSLQLNPSETMRLKMVLEDYEELKKLKDKFSKEEDKK